MTFQRIIADFMIINLNLPYCINSILSKKSLKVFRLKAAILGLRFVKSMMFNCYTFLSVLFTQFQCLAEEVT